MTMILQDSPQLHHGDEAIVLRSRHVTEVAGVTYRQLDYWTRTDLVAPCIDTANGSGTARRWCLVEALEMKLIAELQRATLHMNEIRTRFLDVLRRDGNWNRNYLLVTANSAAVFDDVSEIANAILPSSGTLLYLSPLHQLRADVQAKTAEVLSREWLS